MPKFFLRFIAVLLVPCLLPNPAFCSGFVDLDPIGMRPYAVHSEIFNHQSLLIPGAGRFVGSGQALNITAVVALALLVAAIWHSHSAQAGWPWMHVVLGGAAFITPKSDFHARLSLAVKRELLPYTGKIRRILNGSDGMSLADKIAIDLQISRAEEEKTKKALLVDSIANPPAFENRQMIEAILKDFFKMIGPVIRLLRLARGLTQKQVAERMKWSRPNVSRIERGTSKPDIETIFKFAAALQLPAAGIVDIAWKAGLANPSSNSGLNTQEFTQKVLQALPTGEVQEMSGQPGVLLEQRIPPSEKNRAGLEGMAPSSTRMPLVGPLLMLLGHGFLTSAYQPLLPITAICFGAALTALTLLGMSPWQWAFAWNPIGPAEKFHLTKDRLVQIFMPRNPEAVQRAGNGKYDSGFVGDDDFQPDTSDVARRLAAKQALAKKSIKPVASADEDMRKTQPDKPQNHRTITLDELRARLQDAANRGLVEYSFLVREFLRGDNNLSLADKTRLEFLLPKSPRDTPKLKNDVWDEIQKTPLNFMAKLAILLHLARLARGMTQENLAKTMGVPRTYINKVENNKAHPWIDSLQKFADALKVPITVLLHLAHDVPWPIVLNGATTVEPMTVVHKASPNPSLRAA